MEFLPSVAIGHPLPGDSGADRVILISPPFFSPPSNKLVVLLFLFLFCCFRFVAYLQSLYRPPPLLNFLRSRIASRDAIGAALVARSIADHGTLNCVPQSAREFTPQGYLRYLNPRETLSRVNFTPPTAALISRATLSYLDNAPPPRVFIPLPVT